MLEIVAAFLAGYLVAIGIIRFANWVAEISRWPNAE